MSSGSRPELASGATTSGMPCSNVVAHPNGSVWVVLRRQRQREEAAQRARERQRVVGDPPAGAEHRVFIDAVDGAEARSKQSLAHADAEILRHAPHAAERHREALERSRAVEIVGAHDPLDAPVRALHQRVVLVAQAQVEGQFVADLPPVASVERVLPLARGHQLVLHAGGAHFHQAQQERRVRVVDVGLLVAAVERGRVRRGLHEATRTVAQLGLPVIHAQFVDRIAKAELVRARQLGQVAGKRVGALVAFHRIPTVGVADDVEVAPAAAHRGRTGCRHIVGRC